MKQSGIGNVRQPRECVLRFGIFFEALPISCGGLSHKGGWDGDEQVVKPAQAVWHVKPGHSIHSSSFYSGFEGYEQPLRSSRGHDDFVLRDGGQSTNA